MTTHREWTFGEHTARFEPPDLVVAKFKGATNLQDAKRATEIYREVAAKGQFFLIVDVSESEIDKQAREHLTQNVRTEWLLGVVYVGAGFVQKAATKAIALAFYASGKTTVDFLFANTPEEARALYARKKKSVAIKAS
jgi:hypothetical protein